MPEVYNSGERRGSVGGVVRVYDFRLYTTRSQNAALARTCWLLRQLYNGCIQERREAWTKQRVSVTKRVQDAQVKAIRAHDPEYAAVHFHLLKDAISRADLAFKGFFRRCKAGQTPGYPRFKGRGQYESFTFTDAANRRGAILCAGGSRLRIHGIGNVKIKLHREHEGKLKQIRILRRGDGHWYAQLVCADVPAKLLSTTGREVGVDVGIKSFAVTSIDGDYPIRNPRYHEAAQARLAVAQQKVSGRKKKSKRRRKAQRSVARLHLKVARQRRHFQHVTALQLVKENDFICVEDLNIKGLAQGFLSKQVYDAGWGQFIDILVYKAESAGRELVKVNPRGTSQACSACGVIVPKDLSVRVHACPDCGYTADRDVNAAKNILRLGQSLREARRLAA
jgi:putative transposase